jgi:glutathionyl-hydroquinone reductase
MKFDQFIGTKNENIDPITESAKVTAKIEKIFDEVNNLICKIEGIEPEDGYKFETIQDALDQLEDAIVAASDEQKDEAEELMGKLRQAKDSMDSIEDDDEDETIEPSEDDDYVYSKIKDEPIEIPEDIYEDDDRLPEER